MHDVMMELVCSKDNRTGVRQMLTHSQQAALLQLRAQVESDLAECSKSFSEGVIRLDSRMKEHEHRPLPS